MTRTLRLTTPPMQGADVRSLQLLLTRKGFPAKVDGIYGKDTAAQVVAAKKALHYPKFRQLPIAGVTLRALLTAMPDAVRLQLPQTFTPTHETAGLPGFPAIDCFAKAGTQVLAPEDCEITGRHFIPWDIERRVGGWTCYPQGASGDTYFDTHFGTLVSEGRYRKGAVIGTVGAVPQGAWAPHVHHGKHRGRFVPGV